VCASSSDFSLLCALNGVFFCVFLFSFRGWGGGEKKNNKTNEEIIKQKPKKNTKKNDKEMK